MDNVASILFYLFPAQDENRMDFVRALITGTVDTPYSRGCFVFDIYFPSSYPVDPPLVKIITTGNGTVRWGSKVFDIYCLIFVNYRAVCKELYSFF